MSWPAEFGHWSGLAVAGHAADDEARVGGVEHVGAEAEALDDAGAEAFDEHVGLAAQGADDIDAAGGFEIDGDGFATAGEDIELRLAAGEARSVASRRSTRMTSAPMSASSMHANGAGPMPASSMTVRPASGPMAVYSVVAWGGRKADGLQGAMTCEGAIRFAIAPFRPVRTCRRCRRSRRRSRSLQGSIRRSARRGRRRCRLFRRRRPSRPCRS